MATYPANHLCGGWLVGQGAPYASLYIVLAMKWRQNNANNHNQNLSSLETRTQQSRSFVAFTHNFWFCTFKSRVAIDYYLVLWNLVNMEVTKSICHHIFCNAWSSNGTFGEEVMIRGGPLHESSAASYRTAFHRFHTLSQNLKRTTLTVREIVKDSCGIML